MESKNKLTTVQKNMIAGGIAGSVGKTITAPLSRITVLYQVSPMLYNGDISSRRAFQINRSDSILDICKRIFKHEGPLAFWKGNLTSVIHRFPYSAINFAAFETTKKFYLKNISPNDSPSMRFFCGSLAGAIACVSCYPLDIIRTRLTVSNDFPEKSNPSSKFPLSNRTLLKSSRIINVFSEIAKTEGFRGLYRGVYISLMVSVPSLGISFSVYGFMKEKLLKTGGVFVKTSQSYRNPEQQLSAVGSLLSGSISGMAASCLIFPADVVRKRMQVMGELAQSKVNAELSLESGGSVISEGGEKAPKGEMRNTIQTFVRMLRHEGVSSFYRGLAPELLKVCPMVAITFCTYELTKNYMMENF